MDIDAFFAAQKAKSREVEKSAFITLIGRPNVGKSSILNLLLGEKVAIVSNRPQTTRTRITGVLTKGMTQLVFLDTPGMHKPKNALGRHMVREAADSVGDVDLAAFVTEADGELTTIEKQLIESLKARSIPTVAILNKIDLLKDKAVMIPKMAKLAELYDFQEIMPISALSGDGAEELLDIFMKSARPSPHFFPDDTLTDQPERVICAEMIREKLLMNLRDEVPHGIAVTIESMKERADKNITDIQAVIYCERESHKGMVIGKGGQMLKTIASLARADMEDFLGTPVNLQCWVKVREDWRNQENEIGHLGLSYDKK